MLLNCDGTAAEEPLPFGESRWDYLLDLVQSYIQDLAARSLHRERMKQVCRFLTLHGQNVAFIIGDNTVNIVFVAITAPDEDVMDPSTPC